MTCWRSSSITSASRTRAATSPSAQPNPATTSSGSTISKCLSAIICPFGNIGVHMMLWYHGRDIRQTHATILGYLQVMGLAIAYSWLCRLLCHVGALAALVLREVYRATKSITLH